MLLDHAFLVLCTFVVTAQALTTYRQGDGDMLIRDGIVNLAGFTGTVFQVINYLPVCGTLSSSLTEQSDLSEKCTAAMSTFNTTTATSGIYDLSGVASTQLPGGGTQLCVCGSFGTSNAQPGDPKTNGLLCLWVDEKGKEEEWWSGSTDTRVASSFQQSTQGKSLPHCNEVDLVSMSEESVATRTADSGSSATSGTTATSGASSGKGGSSTSSGVPDPTGSTTSSSSSEGGGSTLSIGAIVGIVGVVAGVVIVGALIWFCRCRQRRPIRTSPPRNWEDRQTVAGSSVVGTSEYGPNVARWIDSQGKAR